MTIKRRLFLLLSVLIFVSLACGLPTNSENNTATEPPAADPTATTAPEGNTPVPVEPATETPMVAPTNTAIAPAPTATQINTPGCINDSEFVADVTIPDGSLVNPGDTFTKTWRITNDGECTWTTDYTWEQIGGSRIQASIVSMPLTGLVAPGEEVDITVELELSASAELGERHQAQFQMHDPDGIAFGTHPFVLIYASPGSAVCPVAYIDYLAYITAGNGFCMLYPDTYSMNDTFADPSMQGVSFTAPHPGGGGEVMLAHLSIRVDGPTALSSEDFATQKVNDWKIPGSTPVVSTVSLDGIAAYYCDELPGQFGNRIIFTVHDGTAYVMTLMPIDGTFPTETAEAEVFFDLLVDSFRWIN